MQIQIDSSDLQELVQRLEKSPETLKRAKAAAFKRAAPRLLALVQTQIGGSGRVMSWQEKYVGSRGGYAAVRPKAHTFIETRGKERGGRGEPHKYAVGYVTNAIDSGHNYPSRRTFDETRGYRSSAGRVEGRHFYQAARDMALPVARQAAEEILAEVVEELNG